MFKTSSVTRATSFRCPDAESPPGGPVLRALQKRSWTAMSESFASTAVDGGGGLKRLRVNKKGGANDSVRGVSSFGGSIQNDTAALESIALCESGGKASLGADDCPFDCARLSRALQRAQTVLFALVTLRACDFSSFPNQLQHPGFRFLFKTSSSPVQLSGLEHFWLLSCAVQDASPWTMRYQPALKWNECSALQRWFDSPMYSHFQSVCLQCYYYLNHDRPGFADKRAAEKIADLLKRMKHYAAQVKRAGLGASHSCLSASPDCWVAEWSHLQRFVVLLNKLSFRLSLLQAVLDDCVATRGRLIHYCQQAGVEVTALCEYMEPLLSLLVTLLQMLSQQEPVVRESTLTDEGDFNADPWYRFLDRLELRVKASASSSSSSNVSSLDSQNSVSPVSCSLVVKQTLHASSPMRSPTPSVSRLAALRSTVTLPSLSL